MKVNTSKKHELLIERLCETFGALYQVNVIDQSWLCETFGITERTAYRDLTRLSHLLDEVSTGRYKLNPHFLPSLHIGHLAEFASFAGVAHLFPHNDRKSLRDQMKNADNIKIQGSSSRDNHQFSSLMDKLDSLTLITDVSDQHTLFRWLRYWLPDIPILSPVSLKEAFSTDFHTRATTHAEYDAG